MPEETIGSEGFFVDFDPMFHCELNFIELYWEPAKAFARRNCIYTFLGLQRLLPEALTSVPIQTIRKLVRKFFSYMDAFRITDSSATRNWNPAQVNFAVRKFNKHSWVQLQF